MSNEINLSEAEGTCTMPETKPAWSGELIPTGEKAKAKFTKIVPLGDPLNAILLSAKPDKAAAGFSGTCEAQETDLSYRVAPYPPDSELLVLDTEEKSWYFLFTLITPDRHMAYSIAWIAFLLFLPLFIICLMPWGLTAMIVIPAILILIRIRGAVLQKQYRKAAEAYGKTG